jgi:hypothetical protein
MGWSDAYAAMIHHGARTCEIAVALRGVRDEQTKSHIPSPQELVSGSEKFALGHRTDERAETKMVSSEVHDRFRISRPEARTRQNEHNYNNPPRHARPPSSTCDRLYPTIQSVI